MSQDEKKPRRGFLKLKYIILLIVLVFIVFIIYGPLNVLTNYFHYNSTRLIIDLLKQNKDLQDALCNLEKEIEIGSFRILDTYIDHNLNQYDMVFLAYGKSSREITVEKYMKINGESLNFKISMLQFQPDLIRSGEVKSLYQWKTINNEIIKDDVNLRYRDIFKCFRRHTDKQAVLSLLSPLESNICELRSVGIRCCFLQQNEFKINPGYLYRIKLSSGGRISIDSEYVGTYSIPISESE